ncbi:hypothetical protein [Amycolatopsis sp. RTGN1]|uniref:hypothetical protein n=1 Tax=Amycolatopsis ponsaeliensis TaxID=2992142 RepID=UPI00254DD605|nr:hypothetical protein [Amycolatopsis sp. RTGN1]
MRKFIIGLISLVVVLLVLVGIFLAHARPETDIPLEVAKVGMNLTVAVLITGVLSVLVGRRAEERARAEKEASERTAREEERASALAGALRELKAGYERVQVARFYLRARTTGKTFGEQIEAFSDARAHLHRVQRERFVLGTDVEKCVQRMLDYLNGVLDEYRHNYSRITSYALDEERVRQRILNGADADLSAFPSLPAEEFVAVARIVVDEDGWKETAFHRNYHDAKHQLLDRMAVRPPLVTG